MNNLSNCRQQTTQEFPFELLAIPPGSNQFLIPTRAQYLDLGFPYCCLEASTDLKWAAFEVNWWAEGKIDSLSVWVCIWERAIKTATRVFPQGREHTSVHMFLEGQ